MSLRKEKVIPLSRSNLQEWSKDGKPTAELKIKERLPCVSAGSVALSPEATVLSFL